MTFSLESVRLVLSRFAAARAARLEPRRPAAAERWMRIACRLAPRFDVVHRDLCAYYRRIGNRNAAIDVAKDVVDRFGSEPDALMLLGDCYRAAYRTRDALAAFEGVLVIEERADAAMAAGALYAREGDHSTAGARYARAYAAGAGPEALRLNAIELKAAGDPKAAAQARTLWEKETGKRWEEDRSSVFPVRGSVG